MSDAENENQKLRAQIEESDNLFRQMLELFNGESEYERCPTPGIKMAFVMGLILEMLEENAALKAREAELVKAAKALLVELSVGVIEELRLAWGNTNTHIILNRISKLKRSINTGRKG